MAETKKKQYNYTAVRIPGIRVHRCSNTSTYPRKRYATRRAARRYIHTYIPYHLQQRNTELIKFIRAKRVNSTVLLYVYTSTSPQQYQYVPKETVRHQKGIYDVLKNNLSLLEGLEFTPPSSARTKGDTRYIRTGYVYSTRMRFRICTTCLRHE